MIFAVRNPKTGLLATFLATAILVGTTPSAFAEASPDAQAVPEQNEVEAAPQQNSDPKEVPSADVSPATKPKPEFQLADNLDGLLEQLARTRDINRAKRVEQRIWELWRGSDSKSIDLLTGWARKAMGAKKFNQALDLLDQVVVLRPNYAEAWNQRATLHFMMQDYNKSIADIERTLALEPRHFGALAGLAYILERIGQKKRALDVWYRALRVYPAMKSGQDSILRLEEELAGAKL